jgi:hypothetical protein
MHAREDQHGGPAAKQARPLAKAPARAAGLAPPGASVPTHLLRLQRLAGNQAVTRALEDAPHEHGAGRGHGESSVQRSTDAQPTPQRPSSVFDALGSPWRPLEPRIRQNAEQAYGMSFAHVRVHTGPVAQRSAVALGALAYTNGPDIIVGPQGANDETMYHEVDHVHQQSLGPVPGRDNGSGVRVSHENDPFERRSAENGRKMARGDAPELGIPGATDALAPAAEPAYVQRTRGEEAVRRHVHEAGCGHGLPVQRAGDGRPPGVLVNDQRQIGPDGLMEPRREDQENLERVFPRAEDGTFERFPDPVAAIRPVATGVRASLRRVASSMSLRGSRDAGRSSDSDNAEPAEWLRAINPRRKEGGDMGPYRRNCGDAVRSFLASWSGNPTVAAGMRGAGVEPDGSKQTGYWAAGAGTMYKDPRTYTVVENATDVQDGWQAVQRQLESMEHGSSCIVVFKPTDARVSEVDHMIAAVNHRGRVVWVDPQMGRVSGKPMYEGSGVVTITLSPAFLAVEATRMDSRGVVQPVGS